ncbi:MAG TPA: potassium/proton antiporter, partial [Tianweitania sediminis]|nr:potassium/proton antiporter [Tianweitania sediminis]
LGGRAEYADRVPMGPVDLIVRDIDDDGIIQTVGISLEPESRAPNIPAFFNLREIADKVRESWRNRKARTAPSPAEQPESSEPAP